VTVEPLVGLPVVMLDNVCKEYAGTGVSVKPLKGISLQIFEGEFVAIIGPSGSGKSTLMNVLGCLDVPTSGKYELFGADVSLMNRTELADLRNERVGFVFQSFQLLPRLTAFQNVELPLIYAGIPAAERKSRAQERLASVGLGMKMDRRPNQLSGGEQQRVAIARALVTNPVLILADEPTGNLDRATGLDVLALFDSLHSQGQTLVLVTHDPLVARRAQRVIRLEDGVVTVDQPSAEATFA
jgi:putative ABC transport system ATP-binding protein